MSAVVRTFAFPVRSVIAAAAVAVAVLAGTGSAAAQDPIPPDSTAADSAAARQVGLPEGAVPDSAAGPDSIASEVPRDSILRALLELEGYSAMEYTSSSARFTAETGRVELSGPARVERGAETMTADSLLVFDQGRETLCGYGRPVLSGRQSDPVESDQVCYNVNRRVGVALGARTTFNRGNTWYLHGDEVYMSGTSRVYGRHTDFTSCDLDVPHYHFSAGSVKIVQDSVMVAKNITLRFGDVPVFWVPFMMQSMKRGRRSGLLAPSIGMNDIARTSSGYRRRISDIGYYWAINDYMGAQVALEWYSGHWTALTSNFDYNWRRQFLRGGVAFSRFWHPDGSTNLTLRSNHGWNPTERTSLRVSANYASSSRFIERNSFDPRELTRSIDSNAGMNHRFDWGSLSLGAQRRQFLHSNEVRTTLPDVGLTVQSITLSQPLTADGPWWKDITWSGGSINFKENTVDVDESYEGVTQTDRVARDASARTGLRIGNLSFNQNVSVRQDVTSATVSDALGPLSPLSPLAADAGSPSHAVTTDPFGEEPLGPPADPDLLRDAETELTWGSSVSYRQQLIGSTTLSPSVSLGGRLVRDDRTQGEFVAGATRLDFGASLNSTIYGFWPGVGPFSRIRHKLSPSIRYSYSPEPAPLTPRQRAVFGVAEGRARNRLRISVDQTFEAAYEAEDSADATAPADGASGERAGTETDSAAAAAGGADGSTSGEPRRLPQSRKAMLLSLNTTAVTYDFVQADESGRPIDGFVTTRMSHTLRSDLLPELSLRVAHEIFDEDEESGRRFDFHLTQVQASFQLSSDSWVGRLLGFGAGAGGEAAGDSASAQADSAAAATDPSGPAGLIPDQDRSRATEPAGGGPGSGGFGGGGWRASLNYSLQRPRSAVGTSAETSQMLRGDVSFQPTQHWSVRWSTGYSFTDHEFSDHILSFTRDLHRWQANFDFVKASNGNFSFNFRVTLLDDRNIEFEHEQRGEGAAAAPGGRRR